MRPPSIASHCPFGKVWRHSACLPILEFLSKLTLTTKAAVYFCTGSLPRSMHHTQFLFPCTFNFKQMLDIHSTSKSMCLCYHTLAMYPSHTRPTPLQTTESWQVSTKHPVPSCITKVVKYNFHQNMPAQASGSIMKSQVKSINTGSIHKQCKGSSLTI